MLNKFVLTVCGLISLSFCIVFGFTKSGQELWIMVLPFIGSLALLFFANLDKIEWFKADKSGFEAQTREVEKVVSEAKGTIKELQDLSKIMASTTLGLVKRAGRIGGYSYDETEEIKEATIKILQEIGVAKQEIEEIIIKSKWHQFVEFDYVHRILDASRQNLPKSMGSVVPKLDFNNLPTPDELRDFIEKAGLLCDDAKEYLADYEHYRKYHKQRRLDAWKKLTTDHRFSFKKVNQ